jgi:thiol:disulfide interchange protein
MKKVNILALTIALAYSILVLSFKPAQTSIGDTKGINYFNGSFSEALEAAKEAKKPIFMDAYTDWCGWCKKLDKTTFADEKVIQYLNENFINLKMNMEQGEGPELESRYRVRGYPTLLFLNESGKEIHKIPGFVGAEAFVSEAKIALAKFK